MIFVEAKMHLLTIIAIFFLYSFYSILHSSPLKSINDCFRFLAVTLVSKTMKVHVHHKRNVDPNFVWLFS